jgi:hypothetical protein
MKNNDDLILKFFTTQKNSKKYEHQEHIWDLTNQLNIQDVLSYNKRFSEFKKIARIVRNDNSKCGFKIEVNKEHKNKRFFIYLLVIKGKILKAGKVKGCISQRSYGAGTEETWTMRGKCSDTNYIWSQIFRECIKNNIEVEFYAINAPANEIVYDDFLGQTVSELSSPYEKMESNLNKVLKKIKGSNLIGERDLLNTYKV